MLDRQLTIIRSMDDADRIATGQSVRALVLLAALLTCVSCSRNAQHSSAGHIITGRVVSKGTPIAGATVRLKATKYETTSDQNGHFTLAVPQQESTQTITASAKGFFIGGAANSSFVTINLAPLPTRDNPAYEWVDPAPDDSSPGNCGNCHQEIYQQWSLGSHANSLRDKHFINLYDGTDWHGNQDRGWNLLKEHPEGAGVCATCHAPSAGIDKLAIGDARDISGVEAAGIHCDFCHKVKEVLIENVGVTHGRFGMELLRPDHGQLFFGPLDDVDRDEDVHLEMQNESRFCAACHEGIVFGVHVYSTYSEWQSSQAHKRGKQCQDCHMKPNGKMKNIAPGFGGVERDPRTLASHDLFPGGQLEMLKNCLQVKTTATRTNDMVNVSVEITSRQVGHRVPTGFVDRNLILLVAGADKNSRIINALSGPVLHDAAGQLAGRSGKLFAKLLLDENGNGPVPFWQPVHEVIDTRLEPEKADVSEFKFPHNLQTVRVRVLYRRFWESTSGEKNWPDKPSVVHDQTQTVRAGL